MPPGPVSWRSRQPERSSWWRLRCPGPAWKRQEQLQGRGRRGGTFSWLFLLAMQVGFGHRIGIDRCHAKQLQSICERPDPLCLLLNGTEPCSLSLQRFCRSDLRCRGMGFEGFVNLAAESGAALGPGRLNFCVAAFNGLGEERNPEQRAHQTDREPNHRLSPIRTSAAVTAADDRPSQRHSTPE
ncbi:hypothetical protein MPL3356_110338 [Mesorhizobium plurifarium]|uniref:Uncharacterized protein n=1 Tax=Mesorhizobium plurifarium TaxID=69974 RepID=A0A090DG28_MESPL|nr:hypothetical protein MPL3356_110338 [Mesorhizobium plurifarium]